MPPVMSGAWWCRIRASGANSAPSAALVAASAIRGIRQILAITPSNRPDALTSMVAMMTKLRRFEKGFATDLLGAMIDLAAQPRI